MQICIFGASSERLDRSYFEAAYELGRIIAQSGHTIVFGAGASGLMGACAKGALQNGGNVTGIAPKLFDEPGFLLPECSKLILTETLNERKDLMLKSADAIICLPGGIGTMDEFFEAITLKQLGLLSCPLILLNTKQFYSPLFGLLQRFAIQGFMSEKCLDLLRICDTAAEALASAMRPDDVSGSIRRLEDYSR